MNVLDLFSGIGGFSLGLERAGMKTIAFCEIDPFCRKVLRKHWPDVPIHEDVTKLTAGDIHEPVDVICGGFPCQDISSAGAQARSGLDGSSSGLWAEMRRIVGEIRPSYVIVENSADLLVINNGRDARRLFGNLTALGYDAEWHVIGACAVDAPHERERVWVIASNSHSSGQYDGAKYAKTPQAQKHIPNAYSIAPFGSAISRQKRNPWPNEPAIPRVAHGIPDQSHRRHALGNAVVPQIPEMIGKAILAQQTA